MNRRAFLAILPGITGAIAAPKAFPVTIKNIGSRPICFTMKRWIIHPKGIRFTGPEPRSTNWVRLHP